MNTILQRSFLSFVLVVFILTSSFSQVYYEDVYYEDVYYEDVYYEDVYYEDVYYEDVYLEPVYYEDVLLESISYSGTIIEDVYYGGIDLRNYKISTYTITGKEKVSDFFNDSVSSEYRTNWKKVIGKYAIGTTIIVITGVVAVASGGTVGYIAAGAFTGAAGSAVSGAAIGALIEGSLAALKGNTKEAVFKQAIEGSADGFMWGAITGAVFGGFKSAKELQKGTAILNSLGKIQYVADKNGVIYLARGSKPVGRILPYNDKNGIPKFFCNEKGNLIDFDGKIIADHFSIKKNGILHNLKTGEKLGYINSKGTLSVGNDMATSIKNDVRQVQKNINAKYEGGLHPDTKIPYKKKIVQDTDGVLWEGVFPEFEATFETKLPKELYIAPDSSQFSACNKALKSAVEKDVKLRSKFTKEQLEQILDGETPDGFVWHHNEELGKMQLLDSKLHDATRHTGGKSIWGGGKSYR